MKKILLALLLVSSIAVAETKVRVDGEGPVESGRLVIQDTSSYIQSVVTDLKTGCQFMIFTGASNSATPLGCFPEFIDPKFKK